MESAFDKHKFMTAIVLPILFLVLYQLVSLVAVILFHNINAIYITIGVDIFVLLGVGWYCLYTRIVSPTTYQKSIHIAVLLLILVFAVVCDIFGQSFSSWIVSLGDSSFETYSQTQQSVDVFQLAILTCIVAPIFEEVLFRWCLFGNFARVMNPCIAAILSSLIFALMHGTIAHLPMTFLVGMLCCWMYAKTASIVIPIIWHVCVNFISTFLQVLYLPDIFNNIEFVAIGYAIILAILIILLINSKRYVVSDGLSIKKLLLGSFIKDESREDECSTIDSRIGEPGSDRFDEEFYRTI